MSKSVMISIQPYWVFLIIAKKMGWNVKQEKTIEVRKSRPRNKRWDKVTKIYCSKDKKSFNRIPKEYQHLMERFLGKVVGEFICDGIIVDETFGHDTLFYTAACMSVAETASYCTNNKMYGWHISNLVIYDKPRELSEFRKPIDCHRGNDRENCVGCWDCDIKRPPQSWCYVESEVQGK